MSDTIHWFVGALHIVGTAVALVWSYARLNAKVEAIEKAEERKQRDFENIWDRLRKLESENMAQKEINARHSEQYARIERKLDDIEDLLRSRN